MYIYSAELPSQRTSLRWSLIRLYEVKNLSFMLCGIMQYSILLFFLKRKIKYINIINKNLHREREKLKNLVQQGNTVCGIRNASNLNTQLYCYLQYCFFKSRSKENGSTKALIWPSFIFKSGEIFYSHLKTTDFVFRQAKLWFKLHMSSSFTTFCCSLFRYF